jgi:superfamily II DNA/RNA helicase
MFRTKRFRYARQPRFSGRRQKTFDPTFLAQNSTAPTPTTYVSRRTFADFDLNEQLKFNINAKGYNQPTPIQDQVVPLVLANQDVIGLATTGSGKTAAFLLPLINKVGQNRSGKVLIVAPTRELALQIAGEFRDFARGLSMLAAVCIGGLNIERQIIALRNNPNFVIGTPGRLKDLERRRVLRFSDYTTIVLDEVDRLLDMGFMPEIQYIVSRLPIKRQSLFFSATLPPKTQELTHDFLTNPVTVSISSDMVCTNVDQGIVKVNGRMKIDVLHDLLRQQGFDKVLVFGRTKWGIDKLGKALGKRGLRVAAIHGNKNQNQRQRALEEFKRNRVKVLLATDIASRGLDIDNVTHVINYDLPESYESYIHRIGRTGRLDKKGAALTFVD